MDSKLIFTLVVFTCMYYACESQLVNFKKSANEEPWPMKKDLKKTSFEQMQDDGRRRWGSEERPHSSEKSNWRSKISLMNAPKSLSSESQSQENPQDQPLRKLSSWTSRGHPNLEDPWTERSRFSSEERRDRERDGISRRKLKVQRVSENNEEHSVENAKPLMKLPLGRMPIDVRHRPQMSTASRRVSVESVEDDGANRIQKDTN